MFSPSHFPIISALSSMIWATIWRPSYFYYYFQSIWIQNCIEKHQVNMRYPVWNTSHWQ